jgi:ABC-type lipoprotein export system ATPase subunit
MQRAAIARALINQPRILLADEPTGNLDSESARGVLDIFRELNAQGLTILMVTHNLELAKLATRRVALKDGRIASGERPWVDAESLHEASGSGRALELGCG